MISFKEIVFSFENLSNFYAYRRILLQAQKTTAKEVLILQEK
jgi:hypothetical protein